MGKWLFGSILAALGSTAAFVFGLIPWWGWAIIGLIPASMLLSFLVRVKQLAGWPGVITVLAVVTHSITFVLAYMMGRQGESLNPFDVEDRDPTARSPKALPTFKDLWGRPSQRRRYDHDTNMWVSLNDE